MGKDGWVAAALDVAKQIVESADETNERHKEEKDLDRERENRRNDNVSDH